MEGTTEVAATTGVFARRRFLQALAGFSVVSTIGMILAPVLGFLTPVKTEAGAAGGRVAAGKVSELPAPSGKVVAMGSAPVIVTNTSAGIKAFSAVCTHLGCIVAFDSTKNVIACPCHGGVFNPQTGAVMGGPPPTPLKSVNATIEGDNIFLVPG